MRAPPAHKNLKNPPGQVVNPVAEPQTLPFGHDSKRPRRLKKTRGEPAKGSAFSASDRPDWTMQTR